MTTWMLGQLRSRLPDMLRAAGAPRVAERVTPELAADIGARVEAHLREIGEL